MWLLSFGVQPYDAMHDLQLRLVDWRQRGLIDDALLLLEHSPVITLGRRADEGHILASRDVLHSQGIQVRRVERGGNVTYHGPGQIVGYPILHLPSYGIGASDYMHRLEDVIARTLGDFGIRTHRREGIIGVWVGESKIAALGVRIRRGVTFHGFALNVAPDPRHWSYIVPCGLSDGSVTSMAVELSDRPPISAVRERLTRHFEREFHVDLVSTTLGTLQGAANRAREATLGAGDLETVHSGDTQL